MRGIAALLLPCFASANPGISWSSNPSSAQVGQSYYIEAYAWGNWDPLDEVAVYKQWNWFAGDWGIGDWDYYAGAWTTDWSAGQVQYQAEAYDESWNWSPTIYHTINITQNNPPTITWTQNPASAEVNQSFYIEARGNDVDGNLWGVFTWREWSPFDFQVPGSGYEHYAGGWYSQSWAGNVQFIAQSEDSAGAVSGYIYHTVNIYVPNQAPSVNWSGTPPTSAYVNQWFNGVVARGTDPDGNLSSVSVWLNDQPFAMNGGGNGYEGFSDNNWAQITPAGISSFPHVVQFKARAGDSGGLYSPFIYHNVTINNRAPYGLSLTPSGSTLAWDAVNGHYTFWVDNTINIHSEFFDDDGNLVNHTVRYQKVEGSAPVEGNWTIMGNSTPTNGAHSNKQPNLFINQPGRWDFHVFGHDGYLHDAVYGAGGRSITVWVYGPTNNAQFLNQSTGSTTIFRGQTRDVSVTMRNNGTKPWTSDATPHRLGAINDAMTWGLNRVSLPFEPVNPYPQSGVDVTFNFTITAPSTPGSYPFQWRMVEDAVQWFGQNSTQINFNVVEPDNPSLSVQYLDGANNVLPVQGDGRVHVKQSTQFKTRLIASSPASNVTTLYRRLIQPNGMQGSPPASDWTWQGSWTDWHETKSTSGNPTYTSLAMTADQQGVWNFWFHASTGTALPWGSQPGWTGNDFGWKTVNVPDVYVDGIPPNAPTNLAANTITDTGFTLTWAAATDTSPGIVNLYEVSRDGVPIGTTSGASMPVTGLSPATTYSMSVKARDAAGNWSAWSSALNVTTPDVTPPTVPGGLSATNNTTGNSFTLNWNASSDNVGVTAYEVRRNTTSLGTTANTSMNITGLSEGVTYSMTVRARDAAGNWSNWSSALNVTTPDLTPPSVPGNLSAINIGVTDFTASWSASTDNVAVSAYEVQLNNDPILATFGHTTFTFMGLEPGSTHQVKVRARDSSGNVSAWAGPIQVTLLNDTTPPTVPSGLQAGLVGTNGFTLAWNPSTDDLSGVAEYEVRKDGVHYAFVPSSSTSVTFTGLDPDTEYTLTVRARDGVGNWSNWSAPLAVSTAAAAAEGEGGSEWLDINGNGIRDEVVRPHSPRFNYHISAWWTECSYAWSYPVNDWWSGFDVFWPDTGLFPDFSWVWPAIDYWDYEYCDTWIDLTMDLQTQANRRYQIFEDWSVQQTVNPANWWSIFGELVFPTGGPQSIVLSWLYPDELDYTQYFLVAYGEEPAGARVTDLSETTILADVAAESTETVTLPLNGQIVLTAKDLAGLLGGADPRVQWRVIDNSTQQVLQDWIQIGQLLINTTGVFRIEIRLDDSGTVIPIFLNVQPNPGHPAITIVPDDNMVDIVGGMVPSNKGFGGEKHFVSPRKTDAVAGDYVVVRVEGVSEAQFTSDYEWSGGEPVPGEPLKRRVSRDAASHVPVKVLYSATGDPVATMNVWIVWAEITAIQELSPTLIQNPFVSIWLDSETLIQVPGAGIQTEWRFNATIQPAAMFDLSSDVPDMTGRPTTPLPNWEFPHPNLGDPIGGWLEGYDPPGGSAVGLPPYKWDLGRRWRVRILSPEIGSDHFQKLWPKYPGAILFSGLPDPDKVYVTSPQMGADGYPEHRVEGNDDTLRFDWKEKNPYDSPFGILVDFDPPRLPMVTHDGPVAGASVELRAHFQEFCRVEIGGKWWLISEPAAFRLHARMKKVGSEMVDDSNNPSISDGTNAGWE